MFSGKFALFEHEIAPSIKHKRKEKARQGDEEESSVDSFVPPLVIKEDLGLHST